MYRSSLFNFIHEIKNHLAVCSGYLEMIKNGKYSPKYITTIDKEMNRVLDVVEDYLIFKKYNIEFQYIDLCLLCEEIYHDFLISNNSRYFLFYNSDLEDAIIMGDYLKLKQVINTLIKYFIDTKKESKKIKVSLSLSFSFKHYYIRIKYSSNKLKCSKSKEKEFSINYCKTIIEMHKGSMSYQKPINNGVEIVLTFPKAKCKYL